MSQRGGGKGRASRGRATQKPAGSTPQEQHLPHAQVPSTSGAVRRPGTQQASTGRGLSAQRVGEKGDGATVAQIGRGVERLGIQSTASGSGDGGAGAGAVVASVGRGSARGKRILSADIITKPSHVDNKKGVSGIRKMLQVNYFKLLKETDWALYQYHVDFAPEEDHTGVRKALLRVHQQTLGAYIFDGTLLYTSHRMSDRMVFTSVRQSNNQPVTITVRLVGDMLVGDAHYIQFFNIIMRKCYEQLNLQLVGRNYFDPANKIVLPEFKLELWPGYVSSIRQHERDILMCVEITSKVMRLETMLDVLNQCYKVDNQTYRENFAKAVIGTVVLTDYNNNTYRIEDVNFLTTPSNEFEFKGDKITYVDYYHKKYDIRIRNLKQPMLVSRSKTRDRQAADPAQNLVYLVPELCRATGLTDSMRENFKLMKGLAEETRIDPGKRINRLLRFNRRLHEVPAIRQELAQWNLQLDNRLLDIPARELAAERLFFGNNIVANADKGDWTRTMQNKKCVIAPALHNWVFVVTQRDEKIAKNFISLVMKVAAGISFDVNLPTTETINDDRPGSYSEKLEQILCKRVPQMVFCVVSNNRSDRYSAIKKKCCVDRPVPSQVCMSRTMTHKNVTSIATKIAIQMNCKLGGAPWFVEIPLEGMMMIGFDVCHDTAMKNKDFGATVATLNKQMTKYFSAVSAHETGEELSNDLSDNICKAAQMYYAQNKFLPTYIVIYRDGVGEGQIAQVMDREVGQITKRLDELYGGPNKYKMAFIIVTKRLNTRFFYNNDNPDPGTIVDDVITSPIKYDFFIVSQKVRQGTVTPTAYNVIYDTLGLDPDKIQRMTYKLTHMYYNCSNTVRVPAPCHYAHKLAFLVSKFIHRAPNSQLQNTLYFL
ncbi:piwi-like protein Siwi isoform X2 [Temnothorax nylanderi]